MNKQERIKIILGWTLFAVFIAFILQWSYAKAYDDAQRGSYIIRMCLGIAFGYILVRSNFGFAGPIKKLVYNGDGKQARAMILLMMLSTVIIGCFFFAQKSLDKQTGTAIGWGSILGGLMFGLGMMYAGGCASGTLTAVGTGVVTSVYVLFFFIMGANVGSVINTQITKNAEWWNWTTAEQSFYGNKFGSNGLIWAIVLNLTIFVVFLFIVKGVEIYRNKKGTFTVTNLPNDNKREEELQEKYFQMFSLRTYFYLFQKRWNWLTGALLLALVLAGCKLSGNMPGIIGGAGKLGEWLMYSLGWKDILKSGATTGFGKAQIHPLQDLAIIFNVAVFAGALFYQLTAGKMKFSNFKKWTWKEWVFLPMAGLGMGIGARLAGGCNVGAMWAGTSSLSAHGFMFTIFMIGGGVAGAMLLKKSKFICR
ncbi:hypothetical protein SCHIN_v1c02130 [Spiroplasma chinense]|uniref:Sulphur transport domain-containing protein n=1 Tax=Spiroplasma chinense TaxID=216932 RepID=A0A5B9Y2Y8_9MOLU|nr:YeeE/YedE family protein [Spiroplasma chinense]QEH61410.1 hypothetical protein SCHIN_v1c02130 [Spiroplasma chinense]